MTDNTIAARSSSLAWRCLRGLARLLWHGLALFGLGALVFLLGFDTARMNSGSMSPTLIGESWSEGDLILTEKFSYYFRGPRRWEVIAFLANDGARVMKRVVGLPGETVQMTAAGEIVINGKLVPRPASLAHLHYFPYGNVIADQSVACEEGYFVLGDDSRDSLDSRFEGPIPPAQLIGRAWWIIAPRDRMGPVVRE